ncbi:CPBP family intramembrane glutamic endopeptidase [Lentilactobacillus parafarraginis]|uniref:CPBP family intramembrane glutamic endopeptidase n=1 Tax=Lentilactobacillus parafarraginis TaxID=390842 RepID=UPI0006D2CB03|nr:CPBP family intramembrane glutamic endopeptidase [Lentilactobacillus parafarraginis]
MWGSHAADYARSHFFKNRNGLGGEWLVVAKIIAMMIYLYAVDTIVSDLLDHIWRSSGVAPTFLFYLGTILVFIGILPGYFRLILAETNSPLRMLALFIFYYEAVVIPNTFGFGKNYVSSFDAINLLTFVVATALVIIAMNHWGYRFPRFKFNHQVNYWWLALLVFPRFIFMGFSAGSWSRLFSLPVTFKLASVSDMKGFLLTGVYIVFTVLTICFKEELIFRYLFLSQILNMVTGTPKVKILKSVLFTAFLFALWHLQNFTYQPVLGTIMQATAAFAMGMAFAIICLYTGTIWITVIMHSIFDLFMVDNVSNQSPFSVEPSAFTIEFILITTAIQIVVVLLAIYLVKTASFEQTIRENRLSRQPHFALD